MKKVRAGDASMESIRKRFPRFTDEDGRQLLEAIGARGGIPKLPVKSPRSSEWLVREVEWQLERFIELLVFRPSLADRVHSGKVPLCDAVISFRHRFELYEDNLAELVLDQWYRDPKASLRVLKPPRECGPEVHREVEQILARVCRGNAGHPVAVLRDWSGYEATGNPRG